MAERSEESKELYEELMARGYSQKFSELISREMNGPWVANRMLGYLRYFPHIKEEDIVDEMLAILGDREQIRKKKELEYAQGVINEIYMRGLQVDESEDEDE